MNKNFSDFINNVTESYLKGNDLNFCRYLPSECGQEMSVIGKYQPCGGDDSFIVLNKDLDCVVSNDFNNYYYGVSPIIDGEIIVNAVSNFELSNNEKLDGFIKEYCNCFMLKLGQEKFLADMARYFVISIANNYGVKIVFNDIKVLREIKMSSNMSDKFLKEVGNELHIFGCPTDSTIEALKRYKFSSINGKIIEDQNGTLKIEQVYKENNSVQLMKGDVFYSGALLRVLEIKELQSYYGNKNKKPICVTFEKSSFGTVHSLDNNFTAHPLLKNAKDNIIEFFKKDDEAKRNYLLKNYETRQDLIENINAYLKESINVNQVGVSGNVQTEDNYFIYGKRADTAIDSNKLYPGVNGNAEVIDKNVKFYQSSMNVDFPSIKTDARRIEFCNELNREAEAELNLHLNENLWNSNGIVLSGFIPAKEQSDDYDTLSYRRMHFNFIFEQKISEKFFKVKKQADNAAEAYENKKLSGLEIEVKKNWFSVLVSSLKNGVNNLMKSKNIITSIFTILLFIGSASNLNLQSLFTLSNLSSIISFLFAGLMVIITVINIAEFIKKSIEKSKYTKKIIFIKNSNLSTQIKKRMGKFLKKQTYHPVFCVCLLTYIERKINGNKN